MTFRERKQLKRLFITPLETGICTLSQESSHYLKTVLRLHPQAQIEVFNGNGTFATARIINFERKIANIEIGALQKAAKPKFEVTIALATPKPERADLAIEKLCELGVSRILWVHYERTAVKSQQIEKRYVRWLKIAQAAARQSGRYYTPQIEGPITLSELVSMPFDLQFVGDFTARYLIQEAHRFPTMGKACFVVGPEGGLTQQELAILAENGFEPRRLGPGVLRVETAALASAAILMGVCE